MSTEIIPCTQVAESVQKRAQAAAESFQAKFRRRPGLCVVLVGDDPASKIYVAKKSETCRKHSITPKDIHLPAQTTQSKLESLIEELNQDDAIDGILIQSPLPNSLDEKRIQSLIVPNKDVDCFHPQNVGLLTSNTQQSLTAGLPPCTPAGIMEVLQANKISLPGKHAIVLGRSMIVGKPMALMLLAADCTVTICHSRTQNLAAECQRADILVSAIGKAKFVTKDFVKKGAVVIDVGINRAQIDGKAKIMGDIDAESVAPLATFLTPVPKGIGPMTIAMLLRNSVRAAWLRKTGKSPI